MVVIVNFRVDLTSSTTFKECNDMITEVSFTTLIMSTCNNAVKASITVVGTRCLPSDSTCVLEAVPGKLDIKRSEPGILFIS